MKKILLALSLFVLTANVRAQNIFAPPKAISFETETHYSEPGSEPRERVIDIERMRVEVSFSPEKGIVNGIVTHFFRPLREHVDSIYFDAYAIRVAQVFLNGRAIRHYNDSAGFHILPEPALRHGEQDSVRIVYEATPRRGIYFIGWNDPTNRSRRQIWTQGQASDNRHWIPMYDEPNDKMITETIVRFDKNYSVLSNGTKLAERDNGDGTKTWHYTMTKPHASYLLMLGIGKYAIERRQSSSGVPINLWYYPDQPEKVEPTYRYITDAMDFLEQETGIRYPWESYSQIPVQDFIFGAMENTTATTFGDFYYVDKRAYLDRNYVNTDVHELTHQWFGDLITNRNWKNLWLHESFATFYPKLFMRKMFGEDEYQWKRRDEHNQALNASKTNLLPIVHNDAGSARVYPKGSAVLDMMNYTFGQENFRRVINHYLKKYSFQNVETNDLYQAFQDVAGITPDWFFDQWLYRGGEPKYTVRYEDLNAGKERQTHITVSQVHPQNELTGLFSMPVVFEVYYRDGTKDSVRETISQKTQTVVIPNSKNKTIDFVLFDPGSYILKETDFRKSLAELSAQALKAPNMIDRYDALVALRNEGSIENIRSVLINAYNKEKFHAVKSEIVAQLLYDPSEEARAVIRRAIADPDAEVRKSLIQTTISVPKALQKDFEKLLQDSSYLVVEQALAKLSASFPENIPAYLAQTKHERGAQNRIRVRWLEISAEQNDSAALRELADMAGPSFEFRSRQSAIEALKRLNYLDTVAAQNIFEAILNPNNRLSGVAQGVAEYFSQQNGKKKVFQSVFRSVYQDKQLGGTERAMLAKYLR